MQLLGEHVPPHILRSAPQTLHLCRYGVHIDLNTVRKGLYKAQAEKTKMKRSIYIIVLLLVSIVSWGQVQQAQREAELNDLQQLGWRIQSSSLSFDKNTIVFSAIKPGETNYDLFYARRAGLKWEKPTPLLDINTAEDELWPSLSSDETQLYFVRRIAAKPKDKKAEDQYILMSATLTEYRPASPDRTQTQALVIGNGTDISPVILPDNQTLLFASKRPIEGRKDLCYGLYFTRRVGKYNWYIPELIAAPDENGENYYGIQLSGSAEAPSMRFTRQTCSRKDTTYSMEYMPLPEQYHALPILTLTGSVKDADNEKYMPNTITVYDAITSQQLTQLNNDGRFHIALPVGAKYLLDVTAAGYSHAYLEYDCSSLSRDSSETQHLLLSKRLKIHVNVFDEEMQTPVYSKDVTLPIGEVHTLEFGKKGYATREITIDTRKEVLLTSSELDIDLSPGKKLHMISLYDMDTKEGILGHIEFENQSREEHLGYDGGAYLRQGDTYLVNITSPGYMYYDTIVSVPYSEGTDVIYIGLREIKRDLVLQLRNIQFEYNSASLLESSYEELGKVIKLLNENPALTIELSAHTDDVGTDKYNDLLSKRRGEAVLTYLVKHGIDAARVTSVGYGKRKPLVPNDSEENRAINRRVEFKVVGI